jgi:4-hydroxy-2-oxoheptanedioate aldolase
VLAFVMLEDVGALRELDQILAIPGLDGVVIGPADLSASLGRIGEIAHPEVQAAIDWIIARTRASGKILGVGGGDDPEAARAWFARGVQWMQIGGDFGFLASHLRRVAAAIRAP